MSGVRAERAFFEAGPEALAKRLLGQRLVRVLEDGTRLAGIIVETEAYLGVRDRAAHTFGGRRTARNESMWREGGTAYVYFTYGMHHCMNVVAGRAGDPVAVLVRALEPVEGMEVMERNRRRRASGTPATPGVEGEALAIRGRGLVVTELCSGPARLCQAMAIDRSLDGEDMTRSSRLFIERVRSRAPADRYLVCTPRIGVGYAGEWARRPLRWYIAGNPNVSRT